MTNEDKQTRSSPAWPVIGFTEKGEWSVRISPTWPIIAPIGSGTCGIFATRNPCRQAPSCRPSRWKKKAARPDQLFVELEKRDIRRRDTALRTLQWAHDGCHIMKMHTT